MKTSNMKVIEQYKQNNSEIVFKESLEQNCMSLLKEKFKDLDFEINIDCDVDMKNINYLINNVNIGVKNKEVSTIKKIIINKSNDSTEVSSNEDIVKNKDEIKNYLSETLNITRDNIEVYKIN